MELTDTTEILKANVKKVGIDLDKNRIEIKAGFLTILSIYVTTSCAISMLTEWSDVKKRLLCLDDINSTVFITAMFILSCSKTDISTHLQIIHEKYYLTIDEGYKLPSVIIKDIERFNHDETILNQIIFLAVKVYCLTSAFIPALEILKGIIYKYEIIFNTEINDLPLPVQHHTFFGKSLFVYIVIYFLQFVMFWFAMHNVSAVFSSHMLSLKKVIAQAKLFSIALYDINKKNNIQCSINSSNRIKNFNEYAHNDRIFILKFRNLIAHHQVILRNVQLLNKALRNQVTLNNQVSCIALCIQLYSIAGTSEIIVIINYIALMSPVIAFLLIYSFLGQQLITEGETVRFALYDCGWEESPIWFRKYIYFMMMISKDLCIKPFGIYVLNLNNFSKILNGAYSYFNLLQSFKSTSGLK